jgi:uncharacterized membrane protein
VPSYGAPPPPPSGKFEAGEAISYGWKGLMKYLGPLLLITLVVFLVQIVFGIVGYAFDNVFLRLLWNVVSTVVSLIVAMGVIRAALAVVDGRTPEVGMLFRSEGFVPYLVASILVGLSVGIGLILCVIPGLILLFLFAFYGFAIVDGRTNEPIEAMKISWNVVTQNFGQLFLLFILLTLILILGAILCFVGLLFAVPLNYLAIAFAWRKLTGGPVAVVA